MARNSTRLRRTLPLLIAALAGAGVLLVLPAQAADPVTTPSRPTAKDLAIVIDGQIEARLEAEDIDPAPAADDATFLRRLYLDVLGTVPTPGEVTAFLKDRSKDKRARKIDTLLGHEGYADYWSMWWYRTLTGLSVNARVGRNGNGGRYLAGEGGRNFHEWIEKQLEANRPYNEMVHDLLTARGRTDENGAAGYYARWEGNPNNTIGAVSRHFLGLQIQCAQCHDHIYEESWKQSDFKGMAAFFAGTRLRRVPEYQEFQRLRREMQAAQAKQRELKAGGDGMDGGDSMDGGDGMDAPPARGGGLTGEQRKRMQALARSRNIVDIQDFRINVRGLDRMGRRAARNPEVQQRLELMRVKPKLWHDAEMDDIPGISRRLLLARWITSDDNPYFARATANRLWGSLLGTGFVNPVDDFNSFNEPSHPEILDALAKDFRASGYDLKRMLRVILNTRAYQRSAEVDGEREIDPQTFAVGKVRPLTTDQMSFALVRAVGLEHQTFGQSRRMGSRIREAIARSFTFVFDDDEGAEAEDFEGSIPQGLFLMNGGVMTRVLSEQRRMPVDQMLRRITKDDKRIEHLYLAAYGREPTSKERRMALKFVRDGDTAEGYSDLLWALVNSAEFMTNH